MFYYTSIENFLFPCIMKSMLTVEKNSPLLGHIQLKQPFLLVVLRAANIPSGFWIIENSITGKMPLEPLLNM